MTAQNYTILAARNAGEKDNPHGGKLVKWYLKLADSEAGDEEVYCQKKSGNDLGPGIETFGRLEKGEYGWRLFPETQQDGAPRASQGVSGPTLLEPTDPQAERSRRIERQHSQEMALRFAAIVDPPDCNLTTIKDFTDWFQQDLDADVGGGAGHSTGDAAARAESVTADVSAGNAPFVRREKDEASPQLKGKATQLLNKAGLAPEARKAIILFRCGTLKDPPHQAVQRLVSDLEQGATADALLAEIWDAHRSGNNPLATRASKLIPTDIPNAEPEPEIVPANGEKDVPF